MEMGPWNSHPLLVSCWAGCWYWPSKYSIQNFHVGVHWLSHLWLFAIPLTAAHQAFLSFIISWSLLKLMSVESVMPFNHLTLCHSLLFLPSIFPSIRIFSKESALPNKWPKYWSFSFSISLSNEYSELISFRIGWFDLLQYHESSLAPQFKGINSLMISLLYGLTLTSICDYWKTIALIRWTFVSKLTSLLFSMLSMFAIAFLQGANIF